MQKTKKILIGIFVVFAVLSLYTAYGLTTWQRTLNGSTSATPSFTVYSDNALTQVWDSGTTGIVDTSQESYNETYWIKNTGNTPITITPAAVVTQGQGLVSTLWSHSSITLGVGVYQSVQLTLTDFKVGDFQVQVSFS